MVPIVELSLLFLLVLVIPLGTWVLLYHLIFFSTHYTLRSGGPGNGDYCGSSVVLLRFESTNTHVTYGAAL